MIHEYRELPEMPRDEVGITDDNELKTVTKAVVVGGCLTVTVAFAVLFALVLLFASCTTTRYVPVVEHRTDTLRQQTVRRDSIMVRDSIYVSQWQQGDTIYRDRDRWHIELRDRWLRDTTYVSRTDTVPVPVEVTREVPAPLSWWQRLRQDVGTIALALLAVVAIRKTYTRLRP